MQPSARLTAAIELLDDIEEKLAGRGAPADVLVSGFFRARRYAGSKDKRAIGDYVYGILRSRELLLWALKAQGAQPTPRNMMIAHLVRTDTDALSLFGEESPFAPTRLDEEEEDLIRKLTQMQWGNAPLAATGNLPKWALADLEKRFGRQLAEAAEALNGTAPLDIRLNGLRVAGLNLNQILNNDSELFEKNIYSEFGYRAKSALNLGGNKAYKDGLVEVQDEAAQVASSLVGAAPGDQIADLCAGAGGKTLAMAADMANKGQIHAFDISSHRLDALRKRVQRAGARNVQAHRIAADGAGREIAFGPFQGKMDRVVVDAPCTGTGTWRRSPDQRWRFDAEALTAQTDLQLSLLREGAGLVKPGGRLAYMTCSVLPSENEEVVARFLEQEGAAWQVVDYRAAWQEVLQSEPAETLSLNPAFLQLAPHSHGTDGFFLALLERVA